MNSKPFGQAGVALISVIVITALVTSMTVAMALSQTYNTQKARNVMIKDRVALMLARTEQQAINEIIQRRKLADKNEENFAREDAPIVLNQGEMTAKATLHSLNARFNLNNLDAAFGSRASRSASSAGQSSSNLGAGQVNDTAASLTPGQHSASQSRGSANNAANNAQEPRVPQQAPASPRLCNDTLNCAWWQYAPQGYVEQDAIASTTEQSAPAPGVAGAASGERSGSEVRTTQAQSQQETNFAAEPGAEQTGPANLGQVQVSPQEIAEMRLVNLFRVLEIDSRLVPALLDWIDEDSETRYPNGAEDDYYMNLPKPYRTSNQRLASMRELLLIKGFDRKIFEVLAPHLSILPRATKINVNTATREILMSLSPFIDSGTAEMLISAREIQAFQSVQAFLEHPLVRGRFVNQEGLSVDSDFYQLAASLESGRVSIEASSFIFFTNLRATTVKRTIGYTQ